MSQYTLWTCPRKEWNPLLDEIMQEVGRERVKEIVRDALQEADHENTDR